MVNRVTKVTKVSKVSIDKKYHNRITKIDGIVFDSVKESRYYLYYKQLKKNGEVEDFQLQVPFELQPSFKSNGKTIRAIHYIADFVVRYASGRVEVVDVKGMKTDVYKLKKKMLLYKYPDINFVEV